MSKSSLAISIITLHFSIYTQVLAAPFIELDFETDATGLNPVSKKGYPEWTLTPTFDDHYGAGNFFEVTNSSAHSGNYSLRFRYEARNNFCNNCGVKNIKQISGLDGVNYFVAETGEDLTQEFYPETPVDPNDLTKGYFTPSGPNASAGKIVYNKSQGYSQWRVTAVQSENATNDKLILLPERRGVGSFASQPPTINGGDQMLIARQCGTDGVIGKVNGVFDVDRRSDCDGIITWFGNITHDNTLCGKSLFRRVYLKAEVVGPPSGHKINYARLMRGGGTDLFTEIITIASTELNGNIEPHVDGFNKIGGAVRRYKPGENGMAADLKFERGSWYYVEQEYKFETCSTFDTTMGTDGVVAINNYVGNGDGIYRLWFAKAGEESATPVLELTNLELRPLLGGEGTHMSFWGNEGHHLHTRGSWYIDDMAIGVQATRFGPVASSNADTATPVAPVASQD